MKTQNPIKKRISIAELYSILVLQFGLSPSYVLDEMQTYEIASLMQYSYYRNKDNWEQARLIAYLIAQTHSTKKLKVEDIIKFHWEKETPKDTYISQEDIARLSAQAEAFEQMFAEQNHQ